MILRTVNKEYLVVGYLQQDSLKEVCLCEDMTMHRRCMIVRLKNPQLIAASVEFLYEQLKSEAFTDFEDCFVSEETLQLVFSYHEGQDLKQKLSSEACGLAERLELMKRMLERMILQDMPCYFAACCLEPANICVDRNMEISFRYDLSGVEHGRSYGMGEVSQRLRGLMGAIFEEELKKKVLPPVQVFLDRLEKLRYADYLDIYQGFLSVQTESLARSGQELEIPATWIFRFWNRVRKLFKPLKRMIAIAALLGGTLYLLWTIGDMSKPSAPAQVVEQIGTVKLGGGE